ncbi:MAG TPA: hypothetical protein VGX78_04620 [Pirellulales bacterium]|jgi:hypothetical protein|nr:hypothetical protein [Pirellulales bacterium]
MSRRTHWTLAAVAIVQIFAAGLSADDDPFAEDPPQVNPQGRQALIVCGLPGDVDHRKLFAETVEKLYAGLTTRLGCTPEHTTVLFSDEATDKDGPALRASRGLATREKLAEVVDEAQSSLKPDDALWVFVLGHAHFDGRFSWLNLPGPDMNQVEFGKLFAPIACREQVFFMTTPVSGFFIKPLAAAGRIVIAATEADAEVNETIFPVGLASALADPPVMQEFDVDGDGRSTLLDVYLWSARATAQEYATGELLATEHSLLDDDGDGRGSEVQLDYLNEELGGRLRAGRNRPTPRAGEGARARTILLPMPPLSKPEEAKAKESSGAVGDATQF